MKLVFTTRSWDDYPYWQKNDKRIVRRINDLIKDIQREPFEGIGKPEPLKHQLQAYGRDASTPSIVSYMKSPRTSCESSPAGTTTRTR